MMVFALTTAAVLVSIFAIAGAMQYEEKKRRIDAQLVMLFQIIALFLAFAAGRAS